MINRWTFDDDNLFELVRNERKHGTCSRYSCDADMAYVGEIKKFITVVAKQYEFKLQPFESVGFVTLMTHGQK